MAAITRSKSMDDRMEKQEQAIQQTQGDIGHVREEVQAVLSQINDLSFKVATMFADWQQQWGQHQLASPSDQHRRDQESIGTARNQNAMNLKPIRIDAPRFEDGDPQGWIFKIQQYFDFTTLQRSKGFKLPHCISTAKH